MELTHEVNHRNPRTNTSCKSVGGPTHEQDVFEQVDVSGGALDAIEQSFIPYILAHFWVVRGLLQNTNTNL